MTNEHWMQLYLQAWWALQHEDDDQYPVFYRWNDMWYGDEVYSWWVPAPQVPRVRLYGTMNDGRGRAWI